MKFNRCYGCMRVLDSPGAVCPHCGFDNTNGPARQPSHVLPCGTILNGQYILGRSLGQGGFGITYIGRDLNLDIPVCIKEYYPEGAAMRATSSSSMVYWGSSENAQGMKKSRESFVKEARKAVKLRDLSHVVTVWSVFYQNETAYIVMDYIEGETLKDRLIRTRRPLTERECVELMGPVMRDLEKANARGIIHRDIKPDNLMMNTEGELILLDMGAAKDLGNDAQKGGMLSSTMVVSHGFSPVEQYQRNGNIGPWTDVYAMCATIVWCVSGKVLPPPLDRLSGESINLSSFSPAFAAVLEKGLAIRPEERFQSMGELLDAMDAALEHPEAAGKSTAEKVKKATALSGTGAEPAAPVKKNKKLPLVLGAAAAALILFGAGRFVFRPDPVVTAAPESVNAALITTEVTEEHSDAQQQSEPTEEETLAPESTDAALISAETTEEHTDEEQPQEQTEDEAASEAALATPASKTDTAALLSASVGDTVSFGAYEQDNNTANGKEPIEWLVLARENDRLLLVSKYGLDSQPYHTEYTSLTWKDCYLRIWLNNSFLSAAFDQAEQDLILTASVDNGKGQGYSGFDTDGGSNTQDRVFLLSYAEAWEYFDSDSARICKPTEYAKAQNPYVNSFSFNSDDGWWWLRSPGNVLSSAADVYANGSLSASDITNGDGLVRPALWIGLEPDTAQDQKAPEETEMPATTSYSTLSAEEMYSQAKAAEHGDGIDRDYIKAAELYQSAADAGNTDAVTALGMLYLTGRGVDRDCIRAEALFQQAAEAGDPNAMTALGELWYNGFTGKIDNDRAFEWYTKAADKQSFPAMVLLGYMNRSGKGTKTNVVKADEWFSHAADRISQEKNSDDIITLYCIGRLYYSGYGIDKDYSKAREYFQKAANEKYADAVYYMGLLYQDGNGVDKDYTKAMDCFQQAAEAGDAYGWNNLAYLYRDGKGVQADGKRALEYYQKAADAGLSLALYNIGYLYYKGGNGITQSYAMAMDWYRKAAELGDATATYSIGFLYYMGYGVSMNYTEAMKWYQKAAELGSASAMYCIGILYHYGKGVGIDYAKAMEWYQKAADAGSSTGMYSIGIMYENGQGVTKNQSKAREWYQKAADAGYTEALKKLT